MPRMVHPHRGGRDSRYSVGGMYDDVGRNILNEQRYHGVDRNPSMPCDECGETYNCKHFKKHGSVPNNPEQDILCAACNGGIRAKTPEERAEENHDLSEFAHR